MGDSDSSLSAGELRQRYLRGGSIPDDELTTSQLRARHGIPSNKPGNFKSSIYYYTIFLVYNQISTARFFDWWKIGSITSGSCCFIDRCCRSHILFRVWSKRWLNEMQRPVVIDSIFYKHEWNGVEWDIKPIWVFCYRSVDAVIATSAEWQIMEHHIITFLTPSY